MSKAYSVTLDEIVRYHNLKVVRKGADYDNVKITTWEVTRPGLALAGVYDYFDITRVQIIGKTEYAYIQNMERVTREQNVKRYMSTGIRFVIVAHGLPIPPEVMEAAEANDVTLLITAQSTSDFMAALIVSLNNFLAPQTNVHGVLMEIHGEGVLITGESGVGKSENAMALLRRGHRLVADDSILVKRTGPNTLLGTAPEMIRYFMEVRGIGLIDIRHMFGIGAVKPEQVIDLVVHFELWDDNKQYDRLGIDTEYIDILGVKLPRNVVPVRPGRNLDAILELAAMNNRERKMGYNAARVLVERHDKLVDGE